MTRTDAQKGACSLSLKVFAFTMFADLISVSQGHSQRNSREVGFKIFNDSANHLKSFKFMGGVTFKFRVKP